MQPDRKPPQPLSEDQWERVSPLINERLMIEQTVARLEREKELCDAGIRIWMDEAARGDVPVELDLTDKSLRFPATADESATTDLGDGTHNSDEIAQ